MVPAPSAMFNDAIRDKLADENPFAKLGLEQTKEREDITVLTRDEITLLGETSLAVYGPDFGREFAAMIAWQAFTCVRTGRRSPRATACSRATLTTCASSGTPGCARRPPQSTTASAPSTSPPGAARRAGQAPAAGR